MSSTPDPIAPARRSGWLNRSVVVAALAAVAPLAGCNLHPKAPVDPVSEPQGEDPAIVRRQWPEQDATFANSTTETYRNRFPYTAKNIEGRRPYADLILEPLVSVGQVFLLPYSLVKHPPGSKQSNPSVTYPPTYTAMPGRAAPDPIPLGPAGSDAPPFAPPSAPAPQAAPGTPTPAPTPAPIPAQPSTLTPPPEATPAPASPPPAPTPKPAPEATPAPVPSPSVPPPAPTPEPTPAPGTDNK